MIKDDDVVPDITNTVPPDDLRDIPQDIIEKITERLNESAGFFTDDYNDDILFTDYMEDL